jgi:hypothetical protein
MPFCSPRAAGFAAYDALYEAPGVVCSVAVRLSRPAEPRNASSTVAAVRVLRRPMVGAKLLPPIQFTGETRRLLAPTGQRRRLVLGGWWTRHTSSD